MILGMSVRLERELPLHEHELHELVLCKAGRGSLLIREEEHPFASGMSFFVPGGLTHGLRATKSSPVDLFALCFDSLGVAENLPPSTHPLLDQLTTTERYTAEYTGNAAGRVGNLALALEDELSSERTYRQGMAGTLLAQILILHSRGLPRAEPMGKSPHAEKIKRAAQWIRKNTHEEISLDTMAQRANLSRSLYSREFRAHTGMSLIEFTMAARADTAAGLLGRTSQPILDIASDCGFNNLGHFHKTFKRRYQMTPNQYRQMVIEQGSFPGSPRPS